MIPATSRTPGGCELRLIRYAPGERQRPHRHSAASLTLVLRGALLEGSEAGQEHATALSVVVKPAGFEHDDAFGDRGAITLQVKLPPHLASRAFAVPVSMASTWDHTGPACQLLLRLFLGTRNVLSRDTAEADALVQSALAKLSQRPGCAQPAPPWLLEAQAALATESTPVSVLARRAGVHPVYLARRFRAHFGMPPLGWRRRARTRLAVRALIEETGPLADLALQAGFYDQPQMTRNLRAATGLTPTALRRLVGSLAGEGCIRTSTRM